MCKGFIFLIFFLIRGYKIGANYSSLEIMMLMGVKG